MKRVVAFLHGTYRRRDLPFYRSLIDGATAIAVDGGYSFFRKADLYPDILIGDFDSLKRIPSELPESTEVIRHPSRKDRTDAHLTLDYCLKRGATRIDLVMPDCGQIDHALGSILLLGLDAIGAEKKSGRKIRIVSAAYEIRLVHDGSTSFADCVGDTVSVVPLSRTVGLTCSGTDYNVSAARLKFGDSRGLRNKVTAKRAVFRLKGKGLVVHLFGEVRR